VSAARRLTSVPAIAPRAVLYLRQSTHREESISLELQESAGRDYCDRMGYQVVAVEADPGVSGRTWNRPAVQRVMALVEDGGADVIVLWKWSRLSRSRRDWAVAADRVDVVGGRIESSTEPLDVATSAGRLARGMMTEFAAFESERIGDVWKEAQARRVRSGRTANGKPRWGYTYDAEKKIHVPDPEIGPVVAEIYRRYVAGDSMYQLTRWLNDNGYKTSPGYSAAGPGFWADPSLRTTLDSGFAAGLLNVKGEKLPGAHEPLIDAATWEAYQAARAERRTQGRVQRSQYLLSGLVRCHCGAKMVGGSSGVNEVKPRLPRFRCRKGQNEGRHASLSVAMVVPERAVMEWLRDYAHDIDDASVAASAARAATARHRTDVEVISRELAALDAQLVTATRQHLSGVIPERAYVAVRDELQAQVDMLEQRRVLAAASARGGVTPQMARDLLQEWDELPIEHRREALRKLIREVVVTPGRPRAQCVVVAMWEPTRS